MNSKGVLNEDVLFTYGCSPGGSCLAGSSLRQQPKFNDRHDEYNACPSPNRDLDDDADAALRQEHEDQYHIAY
jgi:hypothetical protein